MALAPAGLGGALLRALDALEERAEVAVAEPLVAAALDDLVEERARALVRVERLRLAEEDLQHVAVVRAVEQDLVLLEDAQLLRHVVDAERVEAARQVAVVRRRRVHELDVAALELLHRPDDVLHVERDVLHAGARVVVDELVDLRVAEVRAQRLVGGELHAAGGVPHDDRPQARALGEPSRHVLRVELDLPEGLEAEHLAVPRDDGLHREAVGRHVVDDLDAVDVVRLARAELGAHARVDEARREGAVVAALDEAERDVAQRGRDLHGAVRPAAGVLVLDRVAEERAAALLEEGHRLVEALHAEAEAHHARGVPAEEARGLGVLAERRRHADAHVARAVDHRLLAAARGELVAGARHLLEVELVSVERARAVEVLDDEVHRVVAEEAEAEARAFAGGGRGRHGAQHATKVLARQAPACDMDEPGRKAGHLGWWGGLAALRRAEGWESCSAWAWWRPWSWGAASRSA